MAKIELIENLSEVVHQAYCNYCKEIKGKEYWTKGNYSLLSDEVKEADRYTVRAVLQELRKAIEEEKQDISEANIHWHNAIDRMITKLFGEK